MVQMLSDLCLMHWTLIYLGLNHSCKLFVASEKLLG